MQRNSVRHDELIFAALVFLSALSYGCLSQQTTPATPTPTAISSIMPTQEVATPTPTIEATPSETATPTAEATPKPTCVVQANPADAQGPFQAGVSARLFNVGNPGNVTIKCSTKDSGSIAVQSGMLYFTTCQYDYVLHQTIVQISASAQGVSCTGQVVIETNPSYTKSWSFTPDGESFNMNQSQSNSTTRGYSLTNTGNLPLTITGCSSSKSFMTITSCPAAGTQVKPGGNANVTATFNVSSQPLGQQTLTLTVKETDLTKDLNIAVNIVN